MSEDLAKTNLDRLVGWFSCFRSCIVAFSAGVDSSVLSLAAKKALGKRAYAVTSISPAFALSEREEAKKIACEIGIELLEVSQDDLNDQGYVENGVTRCYFCRSNLALAINPVRKRLAVDVCVDGTHVDDLQKPRPGVKALRENGFRAPFVELDFTKGNIRQLALYSGLSNWNRPSEACLSSRIAYGQRISFEALNMIERAENIVKEIIDAEIVRVRTIGRNAVIEVDKESIHQAVAKRSVISENLRQIGYDKIEIDPQGYTSGKMLELFVNSTER